MLCPRCTGRSPLREGPHELQEEHDDKWDPKQLEDKTLSQSALPCS